MTSKRTRESRAAARRLRELLNALDAVGHDHLITDRLQRGALVLAISLLEARALDGEEDRD